MASVEKWEKKWLRKADACRVHSGVEINDTCCISKYWPKIIWHTTDVYFTGVGQVSYWDDWKMRRNGPWATTSPLSRLSIPVTIPIPRALFCGKNKHVLCGRTFLPCQPLVCQSETKPFCPWVWNLLEWFPVCVFSPETCRHRDTVTGAEQTPKTAKVQKIFFLKYFILFANFLNSYLLCSHLIFSWFKLRWTFSWYLD